MKFAYQGWRRQWGYDRFCGGALVWQLNDCWPGTSWSIVDYHQRKKPAYYAIKRALSPIAIGVKREHHDWSVDHARPPKTSRYEVWVSTDASLDAAFAALAIASVQLRFVSVATGEDIHPPIHKTNIALARNGTTDIMHGTIDNTKDVEAHVLAAQLWVDEEFVSRDTDFPQPLKYLDFSDRRVQVTMTDAVAGDSDDSNDNGGNNNNSTVSTKTSLTLSVNAAKPTKGLVFEERKGVTLSDSGIDIVPDEEYFIHVSGMRASDEPLRWRYLGQEKE